MADTAIVVDRLSKRYCIGASIRRGRTIREAISELAREPFRRIQAIARGEPATRRTEWIWALSDLSFEIPRGQVVGIIGRNGSGKSTLLKVLSRITRPTRGSAQVRGRLGSLLEIGTGFHPELTGRENIFLNGAILGMRHKEIRGKFDQIVAFSGVERFLDTPVKHFSSGMYVRLAFAVAAHLEPDILLVDEVLAVGDIDFQKKCFGSMESVAKSGRTVLVVSHDMSLIESLCTKAVWLDQGQMRACGPAQEVSGDYLSTRSVYEPGSLVDRPRPRPAMSAMFTGLRIHPADGACNQDVAMGGELTFSLQIAATKSIPHPWIGIQIRGEYDQLLFHMANREAGYELPPIQGNCEVRCTTGALNLLPGRYHVDLVLADMTKTVHDEVSSAAYFDVRQADVLGTGMPMGPAYGLVYFPSRWELLGGGV